MEVKRITLAEYQQDGVASYSEEDYSLGTLTEVLFRCGFELN